MPDPEVLYVDEMIKVFRLRVQPGDSLVFRLEMKLSDVQMVRVRDKVTSALHAMALPTGAAVLILDGGLTVETVNEATMNAAGWYRRLEGFL